MRQTRFDLELHAITRADEPGLELIWLYDRALFEPATIASRTASRP